MGSFYLGQTFNKTSPFVVDKKKLIKTNSYYFIYKKNSSLKSLFNEIAFAQAQYQYRITHPMQGIPDAGKFFAWGIRNSEKFFMWNPQSWAFKSGVRLKGSGIPLTAGIQVPLTETEILYQESGIYGVKSRIRDCTFTPPYTVRDN